jgi:hypothetical protein
VAPGRDTLTYLAYLCTHKSMRGRGDRPPGFCVEEGTREANLGTGERLCKGQTSTPPRLEQAP